ncbi:arsinothricin resistance N-acetyltransferase ArsN1 family B [Gallaecimonas sp. GXIMD4217]|uniref:arsinothricin resistance N-acetyltransferase ArsN1 family B n=1 Tax=Gallaecimonas sp. GXIMD4217 TaxID=3131927 RepID=UPI00311B1E95
MVYPLSMTRIRTATPPDATAIAAIYNHYVVDSIATFEEAPVADDDMAGRIEQVRSQGLPWLVAEDERGQVLGYAYASPWKARAAYRHSVEITVYLAPSAGGRGLGTRLYRALFKVLAAGQVHAVMAGIALPNPASVALHEKLGLSQVAHFQQVGRKFDRWIDVGYWQLLLSEQ